jgi:predicted dehydrogenase
MGCGVIAYWAHLRALRRLRGARLVAAADTDPAARARAHALTGVPVHETLDDLLARPDLHAVVISLPTSLHAESAMAAAAAGKHFYVEKPIAASMADGRRVLDAAARAGVVGAVGFNRRLHPLFQLARRRLAEGVIGRVRAALTAFCEPFPGDALPPWRRSRATGGGVLLDLGSHHVDLLRWLLDDEVGAATATAESEVTEQDSAWLTLTMRGGAEVRSRLSYRAGLADFVELIGERGTLRVDRHSPVLRLGTGRRLGYGVRWRAVAPDADVVRWRLRRLVRPSFDPSYGRSLEAFVRRVQGDGTGPGPATLEDGLRSLEVILAAECASS